MDFIDEYLEEHPMPAFWRWHQETPVLVVNRSQETAEWAILRNSTPKGEYRFRQPNSHEESVITLEPGESGGLVYDDGMAELAEEYADDNIILFFTPDCDS